MNTYVIEVFKPTRKGGKDIHYRTFVNSVEEREVLLNAFIKRYEGFSVSVEKVRVIDITFNKAVDEGAIPEKTEIKYIESRYDSPYPNHYKATIQRDNIEGYKDFWDERESINKQLSDLRVRFVEHIKKTLGLKEIIDFNWNNSTVNFKFYSTHFDFNKEDK
jgi:hypothetical protein